MTLKIKKLQLLIMPFYKVNVNKLNVRTSPVSDFAYKENIVGVLHKDSVFESVRIIENELGKWHVGADGKIISGNYVSFLQDDIPAELVKYQDKIPRIFLDFHLGKLWQLPIKKGLKVGVIDTEVFLHNAIKQPITILGFNERKELIKTQGRKPEQSQYLNHGTTMACIIAGNDPENGIIGIAPGIEEIYNYVLPEKDAIPQDFLNALSAMESIGVQLVNISYSCSTADFKNSTDLQGKVADLINKGVVIVSATGNDYHSVPRTYPAAYNGVISVAGINLDKTRDRASNFWPGVNTCMCSDYYFDEKLFKESCGTSSATAIVTGCLARTYTFLAQPNKYELLREKLTDTKSGLNIIPFSYEDIRADIPLFDGDKLFNT